MGVRSLRNDHAALRKYLPARRLDAPLAASSERLGFAAALGQLLDSFPVLTGRAPTAEKVEEARLEWESLDEDGPE
jgi:hypothetical protein